MNHQVDGFVELGFLHLLEHGEGRLNRDRVGGHEFEGILVPFAANSGDGHEASMENTQLNRKTRSRFDDASGGILGEDDGGGDSRIRPCGKGGIDASRPAASQASTVIRPWSGD